MCHGSTVAPLLPLPCGWFNTACSTHHLSSSRYARSALMVSRGLGHTIDDAVFHYEIHFGSRTDIRDRVAGHADDIGEFTGGEHADIAAAEQFGGNARARLQGAHGTQPRLDHRLKF